MNKNANAYNRANENGDIVQSQTKNVKSRDEIDALARHAFGIGLAPGDAGLRELTDGWFNAVHELGLADDRRVVLKIAPPPHAPVMAYERELMATEVATMRLVKSDPAIPVPTVLFHDDSRTLCDAPYFFMEKVSGANLDHVRKALSPAQASAVDRHVGEVVRAINGFRGEWFGLPGHPGLRAPTWREAFGRIVESVLQDAARRDVAFPRPAGEIRALLARHAPTLDEVREPRLVHWDGWDKNFFVADGRVTGLIDFERAMWADPLMEAQFRALSWDGVSDALRGYGRTRFSDAELVRNRLYTLHLALVMHTECFYRHYPDDEVLNGSRKMIVENLDWLEARA
jgi:aminoglycoside phosphotransferase (APT) family kinase protein